MILTFGEPLFLNYLSKKKITHLDTSYFSCGGSELNTAVALSSLSNKVYYLSVLPDSELGNEFLTEINNLNVNTQFVIKSKNYNNIGSMYIKNNQVFYQRQYSAFSFINVSDLDIEKIFSINYTWVHLTGITPSLNENCKIVWLLILEKALNNNIRISIDFNYRPALCTLKYLWEIIKIYLSKIEIFTISIQDIKDILLLENNDLNYNNISDKELTLFFAKEFKIKRLFVCIKYPHHSLGQNRYSIMIFNDKYYQSKLKVHNPVEYIGGGDSFIAYIIDSILKNREDFLDLADIYTIENQSIRGNFVIKNNENKDIYNEIIGDILKSKNKIIPIIKNIDDISKITFSYPFLEFVLREHDSKKKITNIIDINKSKNILSIGTVLTIEEAEFCIDNNIRIMFSPHFNKKLIQYCLNRKTIIIPGVYTPTEIMDAYHMGVKLLKFFPTYTTDNINILKQYSSIFDKLNIKFIASGGINYWNYKEILKIKNVIAVGSSSIHTLSE